MGYGSEEEYAYQSLVRSDRVGLECGQEEEGSGGEEEGVGGEENGPGEKVADSETGEEAAQLPLVPPYDAYNHPEPEHPRMLQRMRV